MDPNHAQQHTEVSEPLGNLRWWHSDLYTVWENAKFASKCINIPQCRHFVTWPYTSSLMDPDAFSRTVDVFLRRTYAAPCS